jgi:hypothetical protein
MRILDMVNEAEDAMLKKEGSDKFNRLLFPL